MTDHTQPTDTVRAKRAVDGIAEAADRLGIELDQEEALQWLEAVSSTEADAAVAQDAKTGIFGHRLALLDFDPDQLPFFRGLAQRVRAARHPRVESAIAIAGSAAQGKVQLFPGDNDFFERLNIQAETLEQARQILREVLRETALRAFTERDIVLVEVNMGVFDQPVYAQGSLRAAGDPITWSPADVANGYLTVEDTSHRPLTIHWHEANAGLGWTYCGWIVSDPQAGRMAQASNMIDTTWEAPSGEIKALDGSIDPFYQEIYLEPAALPVFQKITAQADSSRLNAYVSSMRSEASHYTHIQPNFVKASKRLYNLFRVTDELEAAAYVRELFDEPGAMMYQVPGLLESADVALKAGPAINRDIVVQQIDHVIRAVVEAAEGTREADLVMELLRLRDGVIGRLPAGQQWDQILADVRQRCTEMVSEYFRERLLGLPRIAEYVESLRNS
jgi:hypothetical protein